MHRYASSLIACGGKYYFEDSRGVHDVVRPNWYPLDAFADARDPRAGDMYSRCRPKQRIDDNCVECLPDGPPAVTCPACLSLVEGGVPFIAEKRATKRKFLIRVPGNVSAQARARGIYAEYAFKRGVLDETRLLVTAKSEAEAAEIVRGHGIG